MKSACFGSRNSWQNTLKAARQARVGHILGMEEEFTDGVLHAMARRGGTSFDAAAWLYIPSTRYRNELASTPIFSEDIFRESFCTH